MCVCACGRVHSSHRTHVYRSTWSGWAAHSNRCHMAATLHIRIVRTDCSSQSEIVLAHPACMRPGWPFDEWILQNSLPSDIVCTIFHARMYCYWAQTVHNSVHTVVISILRGFLPFSLFRVGNASAHISLVIFVFVSVAANYEWEPWPHTNMLHFAVEINIVNGRLCSFRIESGCCCRCHHRRRHRHRHRQTYLLLHKLWVIYSKDNETKRKNINKYVRSVSLSPAMQS